VTGVLLLVAARLGHPELTQGGAFWAATLLPLVAGVALLSFFGSLLDGDRWPSARLGVGLAGTGLLLASDFLLCSGAGVLLQPEAWATSEPAFRFLLTWSGTGRFAELTCLSLAATGAAILTLGASDDAALDRSFARRLGARLALLFLVAWPVALLFTHFNLPAIALSRGLWAIAAAGILLAAGAAWVAAGASEDAAGGRARTLLGASLALFCLFVASDHLARERALDEATLAGVAPAAKPAAPVEVAAVPAGKLAAGKAVFDRVCHVCHRFDKKLVGPALDDVLPKYRKDPKALKAFIRNPVKVDPKFPAMPKPAVNELEVDAVAAYLLDQAKP
jgi:cytochrome c551/c552